MIAEQGRVRFERDRINGAPIVEVVVSLLWDTETKKPFGICVVTMTVEGKVAETTLTKVNDQKSQELYYGMLACAIMQSTDD